MKLRNGFTLVEALVVIAVIAMLVALLFPVLQAAREAAHRRQCTSHLCQFGMALTSYHEALRTFPPAFVASFDPAGIVEYAGTNTMLLPYLEQNSLHLLYDHDRPWYQQSPKLARTVVPMFACPSVSQANPVKIPLLASYPGVATGDTYALTNYLFCKGVNDAWCSGAEMVPADERGLFEVNLATRDSGIRDGLSNTIAMGEGAGGSNWRLCGVPGCGTPAPPDPTGIEPHASVPWLVSRIHTELLVGTGFLASSNSACTVDPLNKNPVTHSMVTVASIPDCRCSLKGGLHHTSNFRSAHPRGGNFLFADGSTRFIDQSIDITTYRRLSTVAEGASAQLP